MSHRLTPAKAVLVVIAWMVIGFLLAPIFVVVPYSFTPERYLSMPHGDWSLRHYQAILHDPVWLHAIGDSFVVGLGAMIIATLVGTSAAIGVWQLGGRTARLVGVLALLPLIVPSIVTALALSRTLVSLHLFDTYAGVILSHAIIGIPFVFMTVSAALEGLDSRVVQAARSLGARPMRAVRDVIVPNVKSGILSGALFAFFMSWDEIVVTLFVSSRNVFTLPRKIFSDIRDNIDPTVTAVSTLMIAITLAAALIYLIRGMSRANKETQ